MPIRLDSKNLYEEPKALQYFPNDMPKILKVHRRGSKSTRNGPQSRVLSQNLLKLGQQENPHIFAITYNKQGKMWTILDNHTTISSGYNLLAVCRKAMRYTWNLKDSIYRYELELCGPMSPARLRMDWEYPFFSVCSQCKKGIVVGTCCSYCKSRCYEYCETKMTLALEREARRLYLLDE